MDHRAEASASSMPPLSVGTLPPPTLRATSNARPRTLSTKGVLAVTEPPPPTPPPPPPAAAAAPVAVSVTETPAEPSWAALAPLGSNPLGYKLPTGLAERELPKDYPLRLESIAASSEFGKGGPERTFSRGSAIRLRPGYRLELPNDVKAAPPLDRAGAMDAMGDGVDEGRVPIFLAPPLTQGMGRCYSVHAQTSWQIASPAMVLVDGRAIAIPFDYATVFTAGFLKAIRQALATAGSPEATKLVTWKNSMRLGFADTESVAKQRLKEFSQNLRMYRAELVCPSCVTSEQWVAFQHKRASRVVEKDDVKSFVFHYGIEAEQVATALLWMVNELHEVQFIRYSSIHTAYTHVVESVKKAQFDARIKDDPERLGQHAWGLCVTLVNMFAYRAAVVLVDVVTRMQEQHHKSVAAAAAAAASKVEPSASTPASVGATVATAATQAPAAEQPVDRIPIEYLRDVLEGRLAEVKWTDRLDDREAQIHEMSSRQKDTTDALGWTPTIEQREQLMHMDMHHMFLDNGKSRPIPSHIKVDINHRLCLFRRDYPKTWRLAARALDITESGELLREPTARMRWFKTMVKANKVRPLPKPQPQPKGKKKGDASASATATDIDTAAGSADGDQVTADDLAMVDDCKTGADGDGNADANVDASAADDTAAAAAPSEVWRTAPSWTLHPPFAPKRVMLYHLTAFSVYTSLKTMHDDLRARQRQSDAAGINDGGLRFVPVDQRHVDVVRRFDAICYVSNIINKTPELVLITEQLLGQRRSDKGKLTDAGYLSKYGRESDPRPYFWLLYRSVGDSATASKEATLRRFNTKVDLDESVARAHPTSEFGLRFFASRSGETALAAEHREQRRREAAATAAPTAPSKPPQTTTTTAVAPAATPTKPATRAAAAPPPGVVVGSKRKRFHELYTECMTNRDQKAIDKDDDGAATVDLDDEETDTEESDEGDDLDEMKDFVVDDADEDGDEDEDEDASMRRMAAKKRRAKSRKQQAGSDATAGRKAARAQTEFDRLAAPVAMTKEERDRLGIRIDVRKEFQEQCVVLDVNEPSGAVDKIQAMLDVLLASEEFRKEPHAVVETYAALIEPPDNMSRKSRKPTEEWVVEHSAAVFLEALRKAAALAPKLTVSDHYIGTMSKVAAEHKAIDAAGQSHAHLARMLESAKQFEVMEAAAQDKPPAPTASTTVRSTPSATTAMPPPPPVPQRKPTLPPPPPPAHAATPLPTPAAPATAPATAAPPLSDAMRLHRATAAFRMDHHAETKSILDCSRRLRYHVVRDTDIYIVIQRRPAYTWFRLERDTALKQCASDNRASCLATPTHQSPARFDAGYEVTILDDDDGRAFPSPWDPLPAFLAAHPEDALEWDRPLTDDYLPVAECVAEEEALPRYTLRALLDDELINVQENFFLFGAFAYHHLAGFANSPLIRLQRRGEIGAAKFTLPAFHTPEPMFSYIPTDVKEAIAKRPEATLTAFDLSQDPLSASAARLYHISEKAIQAPTRSASAAVVPVKTSKLVEREVLTKAMQLHMQHLQAQPWWAKHYARILDTGMLDDPAAGWPTLSKLQRRLHGCWVRVTARRANDTLYERDARRKLFGVADSPSYILSAWSVFREALLLKQTSDGNTPEALALYGRLAAHVPSHIQAFILKRALGSALNCRGCSEPLFTCMTLPCQHMFCERCTKQMELRDVDDMICSVCGASARWRPSSVGETLGPRRNAAISQLLRAVHRVSDADAAAMTLADDPPAGAGAGSAAAPTHPHAAGAQDDGPTDPPISHSARTMLSEATDIIIRFAAGRKLADPRAFQTVPQRFDSAVVNDCLAKWKQSDPRRDIVERVSFNTAQRRLIWSEPPVGAAKRK